jgi:hypothetical protein
MEQADLDSGVKLSGNVLFYHKPEPLSAVTHGKLGVNRTSKPYGFVAETNLVPLTVAEFVGAALSYPVIFMGDAKVPLAVMGLRQGENLYVSKDGEFRMDAYIPSFVRRYPFVFANDEGSDRMVLCVDRQASFISENPEVPFFVNGEPSEYTQSAMQYCTEFETERRRTEQFIDLMKQLDLFEPRSSTFRPTNPDGTQGEAVTLAEYFALSNEKLNALPHDRLAELRDNGALPQIYAHLISLLGWDRLVALQLQRQVEEGSAPPQPQA